MDTSEFNQRYFKESLTSELEKERTQEVERLKIEPFYLQEVALTNYFLIRTSEEVMEALANKHKQGSFVIPWEIYNYKSKVVISKVTLCEEDGNFFVKCGKNLITSHTYYYGVVLANPTISRALKNLMGFQSANSEIRKYLYGEIQQFDETRIPKIVFSEEDFPEELNLNKSQKIAIRQALKFPMTAIQGPPGTGKTICIVALAMILIAKGLKVMICGPSNASIIHITRLLLKHNFSPSSTLYLLSKAGNQKFQVADLDHIDLYKRLDAVAQKIFPKQKYKRFAIQLKYFISCMLSTSPQFWTDLTQARRELLKNINVICCTVSNSGKSTLDQFNPDVTIIDEAGQAGEYDTVVAINKGSSRVVLFGDQCQLLPICISQNTELMKSMLAKVWNRSPELTHTLGIQYRMHPQIANFTNKYFYNNKIKNGVSAESRKSDVKLFSQSPIMIIGHNQMESRYENSYFSEHEAFLIGLVMSQFPESELKNVGVITPFRPQLRILEESLGHLTAKGLEVKVLDGYQGGEKDYIIISFVRSNPDQHIGYLSNTNRTNVALTRAKKGMVIVGNIDTMMSTMNDSPWRYFVEYCQDEIPQAVLTEAEFLQRIQKESGSNRRINENDFHFNLSVLGVEKEQFDVEAVVQAHKPNPQSPNKEINTKFPKSNPDLDQPIFQQFPELDKKQSGTFMQKMYGMQRKVETLPIPAPTPVEEPIPSPETQQPPSKKSKKNAKNRANTFDMRGCFNG